MERLEDGNPEHLHPIPGRARKIAGRLDALIQGEASRAGGRAPGYRELAERINRIAGRNVISKDTIRNLHQASTQNGHAPNPTVETLDWLGLAFGIRSGATYFLDDARAALVGEQLQGLERLAGLRAVLGNAEVVGLAQRASGLSDNSLHMLVALADRLKALEEEASGATGGDRDRSDGSGEGLPG
ncbi:hypothetical protein [Kitasatospora sp. SUK 42]|uniref:hypothetical protein n=1 Tax=Kitasatospora sp. SUK 42 TaxID=1588882 RepID=UPI0018CA517F|nr:hypothetical protein [Kitasatospora sp. SUK 42]MBV2153164.1 hypothetical protein [Kitasatospora sp. SUK 42]